MSEDSDRVSSDMEDDYEIVEVSVVPVDESEDESDNRKDDDVDRFWIQHKDCAYNCTKKFSKRRIREIRSDCRALDETRNGVNRLNSLLVAMIHIMQRTDFVNKKRHVNKEPERRTCAYMMESLKVCRGFFLFSHTIGKERWETMLKRYKVEGLTEKQHGLCNRSPQNTLSPQRRTNVVRFVKNYIEEHAIVDCEKKSLDRSVPVLLPSDVSKSRVYNLYQEACPNASELDEVDREPVSNRSFYRIWSDYFSHAVFIKPDRDLCSSCFDRYNVFGKLEALCQKDHWKYFK